jgi:hypothetical protein
MTVLAAALHGMGGVYRAWRGRLVAWISAAEASEDVDGLIASLSALESEFIVRARNAGNAVEAERRSLSRSLGRDCSLYELARRQGAESEFDEAEAAVAEVAALRVTALRHVEKMRDGMRDEIEKIAGARKLSKRYTRPKVKGIKVDGTI